MTRRLAAILAADVVGYSRLMEQDEEGTLAALRTLREKAIDPAIEKHGGRIVKLIGDGALVEFASVVDAVSCAVALQRDLAARNAGEPKERRIVLRIGVHLGDVMVEKKDLYGDGVNVAARLEALAEPGSVYLSRQAFDQVENKLALVFEDLGEHQVKNIARPLRVYRVAMGRRPAAVPAKPEPAMDPKQPAVAVLPFVNMSGDPDQEYFADGLTEDIITALSLWRWFPVIARNSTFTYKNRAVSVTGIAEELGARYLLEGSVRKASIRVRVTAKLIDGATGHHMWAKSYDRDLDDIFALQDSLTQNIAATIAPELGKAELRRSTAKRPSDFEAWDYCLRGNAHLQEFTSEGNAKARAMFERATALDPNYGDAYSGLARSYNRDVLLGCAADREAAIDFAFAAAQRAVELDPSSPAAHQALSTAHIWRDEHGFALAEGRLAVELNPNDAIGLHALGNKSDLAGDPGGIALMERAQQLNPQDPDRHSHLCFLARAYVNARRYAEAVDCARRATSRRPDYPHAHYILAIALAHLGKADEAIIALGTCERLHPGFLAGRADWRPYTDEGSNDHLKAALDGLRHAK